MTDIVCDVRFALRLLAKHRGFTAVAVLALALGMGVNTTFFTLVSSMCLRGPLDDASGLVHIATRGATRSPAGMSYADYQDVRSGAGTFAAVAAYANSPVALADDGRAAEGVTAAYVSAEAFSILRETAVHGRLFVADDHRTGADAVAILGHAIWTSRYAADERVVGRTVRLNGSNVTVVGVLRDGFRFPNDASVWLPLAAMPGITAQPRSLRTLGMYARLNDGVSIEQARADVAGVMARLAADHPDTNTAIAAETTTINARFNPSITDPAWLAFIVAGLLVLLIACANVANLLLARSLQRSGEMAIRSSLGASRRRVLRQLLMESAVLALLGGLAGLALSLGGIRLLSMMIPDGTLPSWMALRADARVFAMLAAVCVGTVFVFGLVPALFTSKMGPDVLKHRQAIGPASRGRRWWTTAFVTAEFALTFVLLSILVLDVRALLEQRRREEVIDPTGVLTASVTLPPQRYATAPLRAAFYEQLASRLASDNVGVTLATTLPFAPAATRPLAIDGRQVPPGQARPAAVTISIAPRYFATLGAPLLDGREFSPADGSPGMLTALVNERFARLYLAGSEAIGQRIQLTGDTAAGSSPWLTVVGITRSVRQGATEAGPVVYLPLRFAAPPTVALIVRARPGEETTPALLRDRVRDLDPDLPLARVLSLEQAISNAGWNARVSSVLVRAIATLGLFLAVVGLYSVTSYGVSARTREFGLRIAVGARSMDVTRLVLRRAWVQMAMGLATGLLLTFAWNTFFGGGDASQADATTLLTVAALIAVTGTTASFLPARRAARLDPVAALRAD